MTRKLGKVMLVGAWFLAVGGLVLVAQVTDPKLPKASMVAEIAGYKNWTRVNPEPQYIDRINFAMCASPLPGTTIGSSDPHTGGFITVYVNHRGRKAMLDQKEPKFPVGSIIVKEKLPTKDRTQPILLTVMIKHQAGFNPMVGDWEFLAVSGDGMKIQTRGKLAYCQKCHQSQTQTDFIFRSDHTKFSLKKSYD